MLSLISPTLLIDVLKELELLLVRKFSPSSSAWICATWSSLESQTLKVIQHLEALHVSDITDILTMSRIVDIGENTDCFINLTKNFVTHVVSF